MTLLPLGSAVVGPSATGVPGVTSTSPPPAVHGIPPRGDDGARDLPESAADPDPSESTQSLKKTLAPLQPATSSWPSIGPGTSVSPLLPDVFSRQVSPAPSLPSVVGRRPSLARPQSPGDSGGERAGSPEAFLDYYSLGAVIGQGAFGAVYFCTMTDSFEKFAVKLVDRIETPMENIQREVEIQKNMDHPNIARVHDVFF